MKGFHVWIGTIVGLLGLALTDNVGEKLARAYAWFHHDLRDPLIQAFENILVIFWSLCVLWSTTWLILLTLRLLFGAAKEAPYLWLKIKGALGMADYVSKDDAMKIIRQSDFFQSRQPKAKRNVGGLASLDLLSWREHFAGETERDAMLRRQFLRLMTKAFEEQRPAAVTDAGYDRGALEEWLQELFLDEVRAEMGTIPRV